MTVSDLAEAIVDHRRLVIVAFLLVTTGMIAGAMQVEEQSSLDGFQTDSEEAEALDRIQARYDRTGENVTTAQVVVERENVLSKEGLLEALRYQRALRQNETVAGTLAHRPGQQATTSVASAIATAAIARERRVGNARGQSADRSGDANGTAAATGSGGVPSMDAQIAQIESMSDAEIEATIQAVLTEDRAELLMLLPADYEAGETTADATMVLVRQDTRGEFVSIDTAPEFLVESQQAMAAIGEERGGATYRVFGVGITADEFATSMNESLAILGPFALLFVLLVLAIAYRDVVDVLLGLTGIGLVLVWTFGFMGWAGIAFNQLFVAVPVLLIGLSIDYAIHVFMRSREARDRGRAFGSDATGTATPSADAMKRGLAGVGLALVLVTVTTAVGFLSNVVSPLPPIQEFGIVNAAGIVSALFVFTLFVPAVKVELDGFLESHGFDRRTSAFGSSGRLNGLLAGASRVARRAPAIVLVLALLVSLGGAYGATQVDSSFQTTDFLADDPPEWTESLPAGMQPSEYTAIGTMDVLEDEFVRQDLDAQLLIEGNVTDPAALERIGGATTRLGDTEAAARLPNGRAALTSPTTAMERVAATNESFNATLAASDTDGDGLPDRNLEAVYDALYAADPVTAAGVIDRTESGEYRSVRITVLAASSDETGSLVSAVRDESDRIEGQGTPADGPGPSVEVTPTGQRTVITQQISKQILDTVLWSLVVTLAVVGVLLLGAYRLTAGRGSLGIVAMVPILMALSWVLGTMWLIGMPFNSITGLITSLTIGIGVAYSIHVCERYYQELDRNETVDDALHATVAGTGGALLGSAATTAGGFGVLTFAFLPALQQFGLITAVSIGFAFLATVAVLPSLLVIWTRYLGPEWASEELAADPPVSVPHTDPASDD
ncbi:RND family transporter [Salinarchaeum sp. Harcht-Bsk1]|uniref:efflux RND transporter permease subunit n=1 Tax=Salinarchaeum sp. Harcht-Bsk1 TaxID=1333523 RepID=UPI001F0155D6|nr:MMPL family transporter [Salinarchaeum sp. Harcht-Bsk1]